MTEATSARAQGRRRMYVVVHRLRVSAFRTNNFAANFRSVIAQETVNVRTPYIHINTHTHTRSHIRVGAHLVLRYIHRRRRGRDGGR